MNYSSRIDLLGAAMLGACLCAPAFAALGSHAGDVQADAHAMQARSLAARPGAGASWTRHPLALADGGSATEFADASGRVFAVSWTAPTLPDLSVLLGEHRSGYLRAQRRAVEARERAQAGTVVALSHRVANLEDGDLVVNSAGQLQAYRGHAFLRSALPSDFDPKELNK